MVRFHLWLHLLVLLQTYYICVVLFMLVCIYYSLFSNEQLQITFLIKKGVQMLQNSWILYDCV